MINPFPNNQQKVSKNKIPRIHLGIPITYDTFI